MLSNPLHIIALGFGSGLSPVAPGTAGTLLAWAFGAFLVESAPPHALLAAVAVLFAVGVWACTLTGRHLGVADHGGMVWDEIVAFLLVLAVLPRSLGWQAAGFVAFRFFARAPSPPDTADLFRNQRSNRNLHRLPQRSAASPTNEPFRALRVYSTDV